jgi:hypothetical protein
MVLTSLNIPKPQSAVSSFALNEVNGEKTGESSTDFEPRPVDSDDEDFGIAAAECLLEVLCHGDDDQYSLSSVENDDTMSEADSLDGSGCMQNDESYLGDFIRSNESCLDELMQTLSDVLVQEV